MGMFRRQPPDAGHAQHDALLIAQFAARDPLTEAQIAQATALVASCAECASLASDLRAISGAVTHEPVPARRRDFRIDAETAAELRGNPVRRFMRRLAMPGSAPLRPLAAGIMSLGLVFVIAGNVIPTAEENVGLSSGAGTRTEVSDERLDAVVIASPGPIIESDAASRDLRFAEPDIAAGTLASPPPEAVDGDGAKRLGRDESDDVARSRAPEPATEATGGAGSDAGSDRRGQSLDELGNLDSEALGDVGNEALDASAILEQVEGFADALPAGDLPASGLSADDVPKDDAPEGQAAPNEFRWDPASAAQKAGIAGAADADRAGRGEGGSEPPAADSAPESESVTVAPGSLGSTQEVGRDAASLAASLEDSTGPSVADALVLVGALLAIGGFVLLALVWLSRRIDPDPLRS